MANMTETELRKRLRKLEAHHEGTGALVKRVGDQYEYVDDYIYIAYAASLSNLSDGKITNQSDATGFQFSPYNTSGVLLAYRGFFVNRSIYQSGDPTDYTWESTSGQSGYTSSERYFTTSTGLIESLGNPIEPGSGITWTIVSSGTSIPANAVWVAERHTLAGVPSAWNIYPVDAYISSGQLVDAAVIAAKIADNAITTNKILDDAIDADKIANNAVTTNAILNDAIDSNKIANNAVNTDQIAADAIVASKIDAGAIGAEAIAANAIVAGKIATNAIVADNIQAGQIGANHVVANSLTSGQIATNAITATELLAGSVTADKIDTDAVTANKILAGAITAGKIATDAIVADNIQSNAITSAKVNADAITVDKIDLDGQLNVTANNGSILWGKTGSTDTFNTGLFLGRDGSGNPRIVFGNASSFINFDGTDVSLVNCDVDNNAGTNAVIITNTTNTTTYTIGPNIATINIQLSGGGGGGGGQGGDFGTAGTAGGTSSVVVYQADGTVRSNANGGLTITAAGGAGGAKGGGGNPGGTGGSFSHGSATEPPFTDAAGGAGSTHVAAPAYRPIASNGAIPSAGGGGNGTAGSQGGGAGGAAGSYNSTTYTVQNTTDYLVVTVGAGGIGDNAYVNNPGDNGGGGDGGRGVVRLQGAT